MISSRSKKKKKHSRQKNCAGLISPKEIKPIYIKANFDLNEYKASAIEFTPICSTNGSFTHKLSPRKELLPKHRYNSTKIQEFNQRWRERKTGRSHLISKAKSMDLTSVRDREDNADCNSNNGEIEVKKFVIPDDKRRNDDNGRDYFQKKVNRKKQKQAHLAKSISSKPDPFPIALSKNDSQSISAFNTLQDFREFDVKPGDLKIKKFNFTGFQNISKTEEKSPQTTRFASKNRTSGKIKNSLEHFVESRNLKTSKGDAYIDIFKTMGDTSKRLKKNSPRGRNLSLNLTQYFNKFSEKLRSIDELRKSTESKIYRTFQDSVFKGNSKDLMDMQDLKTGISQSKKNSKRNSNEFSKKSPKVAPSHATKKKLRKFTKFSSINEPLSSRNVNHLQVCSSTNLRKSLFNLKSERNHTTDSKVAELTKSYIKNLVTMRTAEDSRDIINKKRKKKGRAKGKRRFGSYTEFIKNFKSTYMIPTGANPRPMRSKNTMSRDFTKESLSMIMKKNVAATGASLGKKIDKKRKKKCVTTRNSRNKPFFNSVNEGHILEIRNLIPKSTKAKLSDFYMKEKDGIFSGKLEFKKKSKSTRKLEKDKNLNLRKLKQLKLRNRSKRLKKVIGDISSRAYTNRKLN